RLSEGLTPHQRTIRVVPWWLPSGSGKISNVANTSGVARLNLALRLNPTAWLAQQPISSGRFSFDELRARSEVDSLVRSDSRGERHPLHPDNSDRGGPSRHRSLDGNDNVLLGFDRTGDRISPPGNTDHVAWWREVLAIYWEKVQALVGNV